MLLVFISSQKWTFLLLQNYCRQALKLHIKCKKAVGGTWNMSDVINEWPFSFWESRKKCFHKCEKDNAEVVIIGPKNAPVDKELQFKMKMKYSFFVCLLSCFLVCISVCLSVNLLSVYLFLCLFVCVFFCGW